MKFGLFLCHRVGTVTQGLPPFIAGMHSVCKRVRSDLFPFGFLQGIFEPPLPRSHKATREADVDCPFRQHACCPQYVVEQTFREAVAEVLQALGALLRPRGKRSRAAA